MTLSFRIIELRKEAKKKSPEENIGCMAICYNIAFYNRPIFREKERLNFSNHGSTQWNIVETMKEDGVFWCFTGVVGRTRNVPR